MHCKNTMRLKHSYLKTHIWPLKPPHYQSYVIEYKVYVMYKTNIVLEIHADLRDNTQNLKMTPVILSLTQTYRQSTEIDDKRIKPCRRTLKAQTLILFSSN